MSCSLNDISSILKNRISDFYKLEELKFPTRLVNLIGEFASVEVFPVKGYCTLKCNCENAFINKDSIKFIENLLNNFFYGNAIIYGNLNEAGDFFVYDIFTNDNYLSHKDMLFLKENFNINYAQPILTGYITIKDYINTLKELMEQNDDISNVFLLPTVYINDKRTTAIITEKPKEKIIIGTKPVETIPSIIPNNINNNNINNNKQNKCYIYKKQTLKKKKENKKIQEIYSLTTKNERVSIYKETLKNLKEFAKTKKNILGEEKIKKFFKEKGNSLAYIYSIYTLPKTREIIYSFRKKNDAFYNLKNRKNYENWAILFFDFIEENFFDIFSKKKYDENDLHLFTVLFEEELKNFDSFYKKETSDTK